MSKKWIALFLALCMLVSLAACSAKTADPEAPAKETEQPAATDEQPTAKTEKEPVTITYHYTNGAGKQQYTQAVQDYMNELMHGLEGYEHISIELVPYTYPDYATNFTLSQANGDQIDLVSTFGLDFTAMVKDGDFLELDDLLAEYPGVVSDVPEWLVPYGQIDGVQYYIPTYQPAMMPENFFAPVEYLEMYYAASGNTKEDLTNILQNGTLEEKCDMFEEFYLAVVEGTGKTTKKMQYLNYPYQWYTIDEIDESYGKVIYINGADEPCYWTMTEEYQYLMKRQNEWFKKGWMLNPDEQTMQDDFDFSKDDSYVFGMSQGAMRAEDYAAAYNTDTITFDGICTNENYFIQSKWANGGNAIYADCEHPEEAMMVIELLMTEKCPDFYNALTWGLEGIHYEMVNEEVGHIKTLEFDGFQGGADTTYCGWNFNNGNAFNAYFNQYASNDDYLIYIENEIHNGEQTVTSPYLGITWHLEDYADILGQLKAVNSEYFGNIYAVDDFDATYAEYRAKLETAGVNELMADVIEQANTFLGK